MMNLSHISPVESIEVFERYAQSHIPEHCDEVPRSLQALSEWVSRHENLETLIEDMAHSKCPPELGMRVVRRALDDLCHLISYAILVWQEDVPGEWNVVWPESGSLDSQDGEPPAMPAWPSPITPLP